MYALLRRRDKFLSSFIVGFGKLYPPQNQTITSGVDGSGKGFASPFKVSGGDCTPRKEEQGSSAEQYREREFHLEYVRLSQSLFHILAECGIALVTGITHRSYHFS